MLTALGAPDTTQNREFLDAWHAYEESVCRFNPLNTTEPWPFAVNCNSVGVKSYATASNGTSATVKTLTNGRYADIVAALRSGNPYTYPLPSKVAAEITTWGTSSFAGAYLLVATGIPTTPAPVASPTAAGHDLLAGWHEFSLALGNRLPRALTRSQQLRRAALRKLR